MILKKNQKKAKNRRSSPRLYLLFTFYFYFAILRSFGKKLYLYSLNKGITSKSFIMTLNLSLKSLILKITVFGLTFNLSAISTELILAVSDKKFSISKSISSKFAVS